MYVSLPFVGFVHIEFIIAYKFETVKEWHDFLPVEIKRTIMELEPLRMFKLFAA
ncbi:hypothetical protein V7654_10130 [Bacillus sp. JJ1609]|uniref:hypothetical protein n=1 Tax=Bacillus sp. JJ1609 TaxID=3122977 RepID=UPI00300077E3